jgi:hypothetical protein
VFDSIRANVLADRSQFFKDLTMPFYGFNRPNAKISEGLRSSFWLMGMQAGIKGAFDCIKQFSGSVLVGEPTPRVSPPLPMSPGWGPPASFGGYDAGVPTAHAQRLPAGGCACAVF